MTLTPQRFTRKPETVEAVQVTAENMAEVGRWRGGVGVRTTTGPEWDHVGLSDGSVAFPGDWVARTEHGYVVWPDGSFQGAHTPALPSTAKVTEYRFEPVPTGASVDAHWWRVRVVRQGEDRWGVEGTFMALDASGEWSACRDRSPAAFPLDEALRLAEQAQWTLPVDGKTARDVLAEREGRP
ncbi:MAG TPA: hypothetical protein VGW74_06970 [Propionibacteriaceae bacterium]|nr:hypothetical protein [Propionibacteriaceae bacterium]